VTLILFLSLIAVAPDSGWHTYTNTNFVNDMAGNDTTLYLATNGGVVVLQLLPTLRTRRTLVNTDGLPYNKCLCISQDSAGWLWVGTDGGGLAVVDPESGRVRPYRTSELATRIRCLAWDGDRLLVGTDQGLYCIDTRGTLAEFDDDVIRRFSVARNPELLSDQVMSVAAYDRYWVGTNRGATEVDREFDNWVAYRRPFGDSVTSFGRWQESLLVATEAGLAIKHGSTFAPVFALSPTTGVYDLVVYSSTIYLATRNGLYSGDSIVQSRFQQILGEDCRALYLGSAIWVGCGGSAQSGQGIRYLRSGQTWSAYTTPCIGSDEILDCAVWRDGSVVVCHGSGTTWMASPGAYEVLWPPSPVPVQVRFDSHGRHWYAHFASNGGLSVFTSWDRSWQTIKWGDWSSWNIIDALGIDFWDRKWVYNGGNVVVAIEEDGRQTVFEIPGLSAPPGGLYEFAFDWNGRAWLGLTVGLVMIDYNGTVADLSDDEYQVIAQGLPAPEVRTLAADSKGRVWVGTAQGVAVWDGQAFTVFTAENTGGGLPSDNVYRVRVDASDRVWVLGDGGLVIYDPVTTRWEDCGAGRLIPNPLGIDRFYGALDVNSSCGRVVVGTQRGLSLRDFWLTAPATAGHVRVYPNPCVLEPGSSTRVVVIDSLPNDIYGVRVYSLDGRPLAYCSVDPALHRAVWNPEEAASGLYLLMVTGPNGTRVERVAVVRP
jgi:hypothetical protein